MGKVYGLVGEKLGHSLSPQIHKFLLEKMSRWGVYGLFEVPRKGLGGVVPGLKALGISGVNVTIPYKQDIIQYLDGLSGEAKSIGAVNTIAIKEEAAFGYNTDYYGFGAALDKYCIAIKDKSAVILGTGGAAQAVSRYLLDHNVRGITFVSTNVERAGQGRHNDSPVLPYVDLHLVAAGDILINCTPVGMYPNTTQSPVPKSFLHKFPTVFDLIYNPKETTLLHWAKESGAQAVNGLYMLVAQAVKAQELWNETDLGADVIDEICIKVSC